MLRIIGMIVLALLTGCASIKQDAGYNVEITKAEQGDQGGVQPPWRCVSVRGDVSGVYGYTVAMIKLPKPLPEVWRNEISDPSRTYKVGKSVRAVTCSVWRATYHVDNKVEVYDAVMNRDETELFVLLPPGRVVEYNRGYWLIRFNDGRTAMTTKGAVVSVAGEAFYEHHSLRFSGENGLEFDVFYVKTGNTWIWYGGDETEKADKALAMHMAKLVPKEAVMIACQKE